VKNFPRNWSLTRREFARSLATGLCGFTALPVALAAVSQKKTVVIARLLPANVSARESNLIEHGFELGIDEARRAAALFAQPIQTLQTSYGSAIDIPKHVGAMRAKGVQAIIGGGSDDDCHAIADACTESEIVYLNPASRADALRRGSCSPFVFHVEASDAMYASAAKEALSEEVVLWHPSLTRYGAAQLNDRYKARFGEAMTGRAWAAWAAVKVAWETALRTSGTGVQPLAAALANEATQFDGHKGAPLSFRPWDHQLRQPLYSVSHSGAAEIVKDVPDLARSSLPARELLDTLGDPESSRRCAEKA
jgi:hypothetical protein